MIAPTTRRSFAARALAALLAFAAAPAAPAPVVPHQAGGDLGGTVVVGDRLYAGQGPGIVTWALAPDGSTAPARLDTTAPLPGIVHGLAVHGPWLYAAWEIPYPTGKIGIYSLADPDRPAHVTDFAYSAEPFLKPGGLAVVGGQLLLGDPETGLYSFSLADPTSPELSAHLPTTGIDRLAVTGTVLVSWGRSFIGTLGVQLFDVSDPAAPSPLGSYSAGNYLDAAVAGDRMVLAGDGLEVVDLSDPENPSWLATVPGYAARTVALVPGHFVFGDADGVHAWSLAVPSAPAEVDVAAAPADRTARIALHPAGGGTAILFAETARGIAVDVSDPGGLGIDHLFDLPGAIDATGVVESGGLVWASDFYTGLKVLDGSLATIGRADPAVGLGAFEDVAVEGTLAHLANWGSGLVVVDVTTPAAPFVRGQLPFEFASAVDAEGSFVHLASSTNDSLYGVVDVADPDQPDLRGTLPVLHTWDLLVHDGYVLVADDFAGLRVVDAADPDAPQQVGVYSGCELAVGVAAHGDLGAVACSDGTLHLIDLADPAQPTFLGQYDLGGIHAGLSVALDGGLAWFGHTGGVELVDVSAPTAPRLLRSVPLASDARALALSETGSVWVAGGLGGVYEVAVVVFRDGVESGDTAAWSATVP